ncbi:dTDP-4-dehydrorhamnose reductase [Flavobacterium agricola]|uniref:dTDP-4-dehydrorhamnose reductase n=1 Tax=Flavobacterium agricola TaxID=2870839 RepID=A0ABY6LXE1_9FLAO|nr:dTDP-4-dehydrorhamnose reductase [Flavobacterium agricola]UYW00956.1 dTDP-4-dehydrorhamnose reductase [Flavobacterium agricola]
MVVLVTGANGQLGQSIQKIASTYTNIQFVFCNSQQLDITDLANCQTIFKQYKPDYCINTAAYTAVDKAETETAQAFEVNVTGSANLANVSKEFNTVLLHVSTDFVFDGTKTKPYKETDKPNPTSVYGQTKLEGEQAIKNTWEKSYIVRTSWVFSEFGNNFLKTMIRLGSDRDEINVVNDQTGIPTYAPDLAYALLRICEEDAKAATNLYGIYNFSNSESCTWFEFAQAIFNTNQIQCKVNPIPTSAYPTAAKRPSYSVLDTTKIQETFSLQIPSWKNHIKLI